MPQEVRRAENRVQPRTCKRGRFGIRRQPKFLVGAHPRIRAEVILAERVHGKHPLATVNGVGYIVGVGEADEPELI